MASRWAGASQGEKVVGGMNHLLCACGTAGGGEGERVVVAGVSATCLAASRYEIVGREA